MLVAPNRRTTLATLALAAITPLAAAQGPAANVPVVPQASPLKTGNAPAMNDVIGGPTAD